MCSFSGNLQRPLAAAAAIAAASFSADYSVKFSSLRSVEGGSGSAPEQIHPCASGSVQELKSSLVDRISVSKLANLSFVTRIQVPVPDINFLVPSSGHSVDLRMLCSSVASSPLLLSLYQSADFAKSSNSAAFTKAVPASSVPDVLYRWHLPEPSTFDLSRASGCSTEKGRTVVVLLGWLGSKQKHLKRYAEWYTSRGYHAITFTFPMTDILSYQADGKAEKNIEMLVNHLAGWLEEEQGKNLVFHTFSNTGWLTYGAILERFQKQDPSLMGSIKGCIVDSAPVAAPDPQVWASGFSAAFLKKQSVATKVLANSNISDLAVSATANSVAEPKPAATETALLLILEKFFKVVLNLPSVNRRLSDVISVLSSNQPSCPQLYIYSSADRVIPAGHVESFIEEQKKAGREVRSCNFVSTPHVDHFRNDPKLYSSQLSQFLEDYVLASCKRS